MVSVVRSVHCGPGSPRPAEKNADSEREHTARIVHCCASDALLLSKSNSCEGRSAVTNMSSRTRPRAGMPSPGSNRPAATPAMPRQALMLFDPASWHLLRVKRRMELYRVDQGMSQF